VDDAACPGLSALLELHRLVGVQRRRLAACAPVSDAFAPFAMNLGGNARGIRWCRCTCPRLPDSVPSGFFGFFARYPAMVPAVFHRGETQEAVKARFTVEARPWPKLVQPPRPASSERIGQSGAGPMCSFAVVSSSGGERPASAWCSAFGAPPAVTAGVEPGPPAPHHEPRSPPRKGGALAGIDAGRLG